MFIAVLSIGTEITTGQTLNSNSMWLSVELMKMGYSVTHHLCVPDDRKLILSAMAFLAQHCQLILFTGGLGPTADDFTRNMLSEFASVSLIWNEENWQKVRHKLQIRHVQIRDVHKSQCFFPDGAEILPNDIGTADGIYIQLKNKISKGLELIALPGPPLEMQNVFKNGVFRKLNERLPECERWMQKIWTIKGLPESEVATRVNSELSVENSNLVAYRVHDGLVDVKLLFQKKDQGSYEIIGNGIEKALQSWIIEKQV